MIWDIDIEEAFYSFMTVEFSEQNVVQIMDSIDNNAFEIVYPMTSASRLVALYCESEYVFRGSELDWFDLAHEVITVRHVADNKFTLFFIHLNCSEEEYYLVSAAIIKLFNVAFPGLNIFMIKVGKTIAMGSARSFYSKDYSGFTITGPISEETIGNYSELFVSLSLAELIEVPDIIRSFSPQENVPDASFQSDNHTEDILGLRSIYDRYCKVEPSDELDRYSEESEPESFRESYRRTEAELKGLAEAENVTSYEDLEKTEVISVKRDSSSITDDESTTSEAYNYSDEAYRDPEQLLKELMEKKKEE